jgi:cellobiose phosphorylase
MYRLIVESLLGLAREGDRLRFAPCLPRDWTECAIRYRYGSAVYAITVRQVDGTDPARVTVDGVERPDGAIHLVDDQGEHRVLVEVSAPRV